MTTVFVLFCFSLPDFSSHFLYTQNVSLVPGSWMLFVNVFTPPMAGARLEPDPVPLCEDLSSAVTRVLSCFSLKTPQLLCPW